MITCDVTNCGADGDRCRAAMIGALQVGPYDIYDREDWAQALT